MKKNILILSKNQYFISGFKKNITSNDVRVFDEDELECFIYMCSTELNQRVMIIYDRTERSILPLILEDFKECLISVDDLNNMELLHNEKFATSLYNRVKIKKARAHEVIILFYYIHLGMTYLEISKRLSMDKRRISYVLTSYIRSKNFTNKNIFYLTSIDDAEMEVKMIA